MSVKNARFWAWINGGPVKLTLRPGQRLEHCEGGPTDEGWHLDSTAWEYAEDEPVIYREWCSDGRDCDGRLTRGGEDCCDVASLEADADGEVWPQWQEHRDHGVYDEFAQAAGY